MIRRKFFLMAGIMTMVFAIMTGCKSEEVEVRTEKVAISTEKKTKDKDSNKSDGEEISSKDDKTDKNDKTETDEMKNTDDKGSGTEESTGSEEETTPMEGSSGNDQTSSSEKVTTGSKETTKHEVVVQPTTTQPIATQPTTTQPVTTQPATQAPTQPPTQAPTEAPTQNYGAIINKNTYNVEYYSRRGIPDSTYAVAENIIKNILNTSMSEAQRVRAIHDWLVKNVNYDYDTANNIGGVTGNESAFTAEGSLINKLAVCEGYSEGFLLLCWTAGIEVRLVEGTGNGGAHEWNVVKVDGKWYQIDVTFDDPLVNGVVDYAGGNLSYDYFLITTDDMCKNHVISSCYNDTLPSCVSKDFYEYAKQCTFEVKLGSTPFTIIGSYADADAAINSYNSQRIMKFALVYPEGSLNYNELLSRAVNATVKNLSVGVSGGLTVSSSVGYSIAIITLTTT